MCRYAIMHEEVSLRNLPQKMKLNKSISYKDSLSLSTQLEAISGQCWWDSRSRSIWNCSNWWSFIQDSLNLSSDLQFTQFFLSRFGGTILNDPITVSITVTFMMHKMFGSLAKSRYLLSRFLTYIFTEWFAGKAKSYRWSHLLFIH